MFITDQYSLLLFIMVFEALLCQFRSRCPQELLYSDDLIAVMEQLIEKFKKWKGVENKGLRINMKKTNNGK